MPLGPASLNPAWFDDRLWRWCERSRSRMSLGHASQCRMESPGNWQSPPCEHVPHCLPFMAATVPPTLSVSRTAAPRWGPDLGGLRSMHGVGPTFVPNGRQASRRKGKDTVRNQVQDRAQVRQHSDQGPGPINPAHEQANAVGPAADGEQWPIPGVVGTVDNGSPLHSSIGREIHGPARGHVVLQGIEQDDLIRRHCCRTNWRTYARANGEPQGPHQTWIRTFTLSSRLRARAAGELAAFVRAIIGFAVDLDSRCL